MPTFPAKVFFHCIQPAEEGGEVTREPGTTHESVGPIARGLYYPRTQPTRSLCTSFTPTQTPILPSWEIAARLEAKHPAFVKKLEEGVRYVRVMPEEDDPSSGASPSYASPLCPLFVCLVA